MSYLRQSKQVGSSLDDLEVVLSRNLTLEDLEAKSAVCSTAPLVTPSTDAYSESSSTATSSSVDSSGRSSPVSNTSTAISDFEFDLEDGGQLYLDERTASELANFSTSLQRDSRGRKLWKGGRPAARSISVSDRRPVQWPLSRERLAGHSQDNSPSNSPSECLSPDVSLHAASAPGVSVMESGRGSAQVARPGPTSAAAEGIFEDDSPGTSEEAREVDDTVGSQKPEMLAVSTQEQEDDADSICDSDIKEEAALPPRSPLLDQQTTEDICDLVLKKAFTIGLQDLPYPGDALESVARCLEELSTIVHSDLPVNTSAPFSSVPSGSHSAVPPGDYYKSTSSKSCGKRRATSNDDSRQPNDDQDDIPSEDEHPSPPTKSKKLRIDPPQDNRYACPYRRRNPLRFNVRDSTTCATTSFPDMTNLKRHIKLYHRRPQPPTDPLPYVCFRCGVDQASRDGLLAHVQLPPSQMCAAISHSSASPQPEAVDPEEGITQPIEDALNERKSKSKIDSWPALWQALFGTGDEVLSSEFEPPVEWDEVKAEFEGTREMLTNRVQLEAVTIKELRPEAQAYVARHMDGTCWEYIESVLGASRLMAECGGGRGRKTRRRTRRGEEGGGGEVGDGRVAGGQRVLLPKPESIGPNEAVIVTNGSSLSSSWETAVSDGASSCNMLSTSALTDITTPGEVQLCLPHQKEVKQLGTPVSVVPLAQRTALAGFIGEVDMGCGSRTEDLYMADGEYALQNGLGCLFGYGGDCDDGVSEHLLFDGVDTQFSLGFGDMGGLHQPQL